LLLLLGVRGVIVSVFVVDYLAQDLRGRGGLEKTWNKFIRRVEFGFGFGLGYVVRRDRRST